MAVRKFYDLVKFTDIIADTIPLAVALDISNRAKNIVRVDSGDLRGSISFKKVKKNESMVFTRSAHAAAQEWGLAVFGKPNYSYTPYLRPAAQDSSQQSNLSEIIRIASNAALQRSRI